MWDTASHTCCDYHKAIKMEKHWGSHAGLLEVDFWNILFSKRLWTTYIFRVNFWKNQFHFWKQNSRKFLKMEKSELERFSCYFTKALWLMCWWSRTSMYRKDVEWLKYIIYIQMSYSHWNFNDKKKSINLR